MVWAVIVGVIVVSSIVAVHLRSLSMVRKRLSEVDDGIQCGYMSKAVAVPFPYALLSRPNTGGLELYSMFEAIHFASITGISERRIFVKIVVRIEGLSENNEKISIDVAGRNIDDVKETLFRWFPQGRVG